jgi:hypothetical protein
MSCPRYLRNKYRCLLNPNVIVSNDNNIYEPNPKLTPNPHIYPYYDPLGRYPGMMPYVANGNDIKMKANPKNEKTVKPTMTPHYGYWSSSSSSSSEDDTCRYY